MFQQIFNQAWTISAVKEYDQDSSEFYSTIYKAYNMCMVITCAGLILFDKVRLKRINGILIPRKERKKYGNNITYYGSRYR